MWLSDLHIKTFFDALSVLHPTLTFVDSLVVSTNGCIDQSSKEIIDNHLTPFEEGVFTRVFFPFNIDGSHWVLAFFCHDFPEDFFILDSMKHHRDYYSRIEYLMQKISPGRSMVIIY